MAAKTYLLCCVLFLAFALSHQNYNVYYLDYFCKLYFNNELQKYAPIAINVRNPETAPPLSTALLTWKRSQIHEKAYKYNCSLDITRSNYLLPNDHYDLVITGGVGKGYDQPTKCADKVEVSVGSMENWQNVYNSCKSQTKDLSYTITSNDSIRVRTTISEGSRGVPFTFVVTAARKEDATGCGELFACQNNLCVNQDLKCDGKDNCGDASDEAEVFNCPVIEDEDHESEEANWLLLGLVLGGFVVVFLTIAVAIFLIANQYSKKAKSRLMREAQTETEEPEKQPISTYKDPVDPQTEVKSEEFKYSEPPNMDVEAENPLYESADSSDSSRKEDSPV